MRSNDLHEDRLRLGLFYPNTPSIHVTSPAVAKANPGYMSLDVQRAVAGTAESIGMDYLFIADRWSPYGRESTLAQHQDPMLAAFVLGATLIGLTERLDIITTIHTTYMHPVHIARIGANLDALSSGRWAWNIVTGFTEGEMAMSERSVAANHNLRYEMAREMVALIKEIWDGCRSGNSDINWHGTHYSAQGSLVGPGPMQTPYPLLVNAGASYARTDLAAQHCDYVFLTDISSESILARKRLIAERAEKYNRAPDAVRIMLAVTVLIRDTQEKADAVRRWINETIDLGAERNFATALMGGIESIRDAFQVQDESALLKTWGGAILDGPNANFSGPPDTSSAGNHRSIPKSSLPRIAVDVSAMASGRDPAIRRSSSTASERSRGMDTSRPTRLELVMLRHPPSQGSLGEETRRRNDLGDLLVLDYQHEGRCAAHPQRYLEAIQFDIYTSLLRHHDTAVSRVTRSTAAFPLSRAAARLTRVSTSERMTNRIGRRLKLVQSNRQSNDVALSVPLKTSGWRSRYTVAFLAMIDCINHKVHRSSCLEAVT